MKPPPSLIQCSAQSSFNADSQPRQRRIRNWLLAVWLAAGAVLPAPAQVPEVIQHLGFVEVNGVPFTGSGQFKFAIVNAAGSTTHWSHDGTSVGGAAPAGWIITNLVRGRYTVPLGDLTVPGMTQPLAAAVTANPGLYLRVWFNDGVNGQQQLAPDQPLASVAYALRAATVAANATFSGQSTFTGNVVLGSIGATERLNVGGNIRVADDGSIFGLDRLVGFNDLRLFGDAAGGPDLYIGTNGKVGLGTTSLNSQVNISGPDNNGSSAGLQISSGAQRLLLDGNEIDSNETLQLNFNGPHDISLVNGGGRVSIGPIAATERLNVNGNIRLRDDSSIFGLDLLVGYNNLVFYGDSTGGPDFSIGAAGNIGHRARYSNVSFNIRGDVFAGEAQHLRVEDFFGFSILEVQSDRDVGVSGDFFVVNGSKDFVIDHPQAPAEKVLRHNTVEGPGYYTFYHGRVRLDERGEAWVQLPGYFDVLNTAPHYQLTCIGRHAPVYVEEEAEGNRFKIAGGQPGLQVCWQVTAERNDPFARDHPYEAEVGKSADERGRYYYPQGYDAPATQGIQSRPSR